MGAGYQHLLYPRYGRLSLQVRLRLRQTRPGGPIQDGRPGGRGQGRDVQLYLPRLRQDAARGEPDLRPGQYARDLRRRGHREDHADRTCDKAPDRTGRGGGVRRLPLRARGIVHKRRVPRHGRRGHGPLGSSYSEKGILVTETAEGTPLWEPSEQLKENARISEYMQWLKDEKGLSFADYNELWEWSVGDLEGFWSSIWEYCGIEASKPHERVLGKREMPGAEWFPGAELNYAQHVLRHAADRPDEPAILHQSEVRSLGEVSWGELQER